MWLALLKNPLTKLVAEKTIGAVTHKLKKDYSLLRITNRTYKRIICGLVL